MKQLILIRHAKSDWKNPEFADYQRPLNDRGRKDAPEMGRRMKKLNVIPELILLSNSERTKETMSLFIPEAGWHDVEKIEKDYLYLASLLEYLKTVEKMTDDKDVFCICGHNPTITDVFNFYTSENIVEVPTCGTIILEFDVEYWNQIGHNTGKIIHYDYPKKK